MEIHVLVWADTKLSWAKLVNVDPPPSDKSALKGTSI